MRVGPFACSEGTKGMRSEEGKDEFRSPHSSPQSHSTTALRRYCTTSWRSVPGVLRQLGVSVDLSLRNRHQDRARCRGRLEFPAGGVLTVPNEILPALGLTSELEQTLLKNDIARQRTRERLIRLEDASTQRVDQRQPCLTPQLELRLRLDQIDLAEAEEREVIAVLLIHVIRVARPFRESRSFGLGGGSLVCDADGEDERI